MRAYRVDFATHHRDNRDSHQAVVLAADLGDAMRQLREEMVSRWPELEDYSVGDVGEITYGNPWLVF